MKRAWVRGVGAYLPSRVVGNVELEPILNTSDEWIRNRTGILRRRYAAAGETVSVLGAHASKVALEDAGLAPEEIDCVIFATLSPDYTFPGSACLVQAALGMREVPAFDVRNQCSGFLYGLEMARTFVESGRYQRILLIGAEVHSTGLDMSPAGRDVSVLFGDGAGAVVLEASPGDHGVLEVTLGADGSFAKALWCEGPASSRFPARVSPEFLAEGAHFPKMNGRLVMRHAVQRMKSSIERVLEKQGLSVSDLDAVVPHQANARITTLLTRMLGVAEEKVMSNISEYGNTTAASIPIALWEWSRSEAARDDALVALASFGSGFTWGAALLRWRR